jgi:RNA polymerase sigma-70 factor (ECF subfamily)
MPLTDPSQDLVLLKQIAEGDASAFAKLYRRHQAPLYRFALLRCGSSEMADDVIQEIFMGLMVNSFKFDPARGPLQSFLFGVARNLLMKREDSCRRLVPIRHENGDGDGDGEFADSPVLLAGTEDDGETRLLANERAERVRMALANLAPHYRDVVILYEMHDLSYLEIAAICHIDVGTVRSRLSRARSRLAAMLGEYSHDGAGSSTAQAR